MASRFWPTPTDRQAYGRLCRLLTQGNLKAKKGECHLTFAEILAASEGQMLIALPPPALFASSSPVERSETCEDDRAKRGGGGIGGKACVGAGPSTRMETPYRGAPSTVPRGRSLPRCAGEDECFHRAARDARRRGAGPHLPRRRALSSRRRAAPSRLARRARRAPRTRRSSPSTTSSYHVPERRPLADVLTCIREKCTHAPKPACRSPSMPNGI